MSQYRFAHTGISQETFITFVFILFWILVSIVSTYLICDQDLPTQLGLATGIFGVAATLLSLIIKDLLSSYGKKAQSVLPAEDKQLEEIENSIVTIEQSLSRSNLSQSKSKELDDALETIRGVRQRILTVRKAVRWLENSKLCEELVSASIQIVLEENSLELYYPTTKEQKEAVKLFNSNLRDCLNWAYESLKLGVAMGDKALKRTLVKPPRTIYVLALETMQNEIMKRCSEQPEVGKKINSYLQILINSLSS